MSQPRNIPRTVTQSQMSTWKTSTTIPKHWRRMTPKQLSTAFRRWVLATHSLHSLTDWWVYDGNVYSLLAGIGAGGREGRMGVQSPKTDDQNQLQASKKWNALWCCLKMSTLRLWVRMISACEFVFMTYCHSHCNFNALSPVELCVSCRPTSQRWCLGTSSCWRTSGALWPETTQRSPSTPS